MLSWLRRNDDPEASTKAARAWNQWEMLKLPLPILVARFQQQPSASDSSNTAGIIARFLEVPLKAAVAPLFKLLLAGAVLMLAFYSATLLLSLMFGLDFRPIAF